MFFRRPGGALVFLAFAATSSVLRFATVYGQQVYGDNDSAEADLSFLNVVFNEPDYVPIEDLEPNLEEIVAAASYLPPGWTEEKYSASTDEERAALPFDILIKVLQRDDAERTISAEIDARRSIANTARLESGLSALPEPGQTSYVKIVQEYELEEWGFVVFRADYSDDERWRRFMTRFHEMVDQQVNPALGEGVEPAKDTLHFKVVQDEATFKGASVKDVAMYYQNMRAESAIPDGLDHSMCLLVDEGSIASVLEPQPSRRQVPFVQALAVDDLVSMDLPVPLADENEVEDFGNYVGYFKVAISSLLHELWPVTVTMSLTPKEIAVSEDKIFKGLFLAWLD